MRQPTNLGLVGNALWLRDEAQGRYFMWLADDDEISPNYLSSLVAILDADETVATAMGNWIRFTDAEAAVVYANARFVQPDPHDRARAFIRDTDDAFFYGVHRTALVKQASFDDFWWPNRGTYPNWCYVLLMDVVLRGRVEVAADSSVQWRNHSYERKLYAPTQTSPQQMVRRLNVHWLYLRKVRSQLGAMAALRMSVTSAQALLHDWGGILRTFLARAIRRRHKPTPSDAGEVTALESTRATDSC